MIDECSYGHGEHNRKFCIQAPEIKTADVEKHVADDGFYGDPI